MMPSLSPAEAHIWTARLLSCLHPKIEKTLSADECDRARRFRFPEHRLRYAFAHRVLRDVLSQYLHCAPAYIRFSEDSFGKPFLDATDHDRVPEFNLSHADSLVLVAVCGGRRVGIDVEQIRPLDDLRLIARSFYTAQECAFIFRQAPGDQARAFFRCWTRKEAYVKAVGKGLLIPLNSFDTVMSSGEPRRFVGSDSTSADSAGWQLADVDVPEGYTAAIAVETGVNRLVYFEWRTGIT